ncbi:MAG: HAMP domain-containing protein [Pseudomonadota bacterium]
MIQRFISKKIWLVNRDFQLRYAGAGLAAGIISTIITATLILYPLFAFKIITLGLFLPWPIFACMLLAAILNGMVQMWFGIVLTHKVAGPMFSLIRHLRSIGAGQWNIKMGQREGDELQMIVRHLNEMSDHLVLATRNDLDVLDKIKLTVSQFNGEAGERDFLLTAIENLCESLKKRITTPTKDTHHD